MAFTRNNLEPDRQGNPIAHFVDGGSNDSDKQETVPANETWEVVHVWVEYQATATVGTRVIEVNARSAGDVIWAAAITGPAASQDMNFLFTPAGAAQAAAAGPGQIGAASLPSPAIVPASGILRIRDSAGVDPAADDMVTHFLVRVR